MQGTNTSSSRVWRVASIVLFLIAGQTYADSLISMQNIHNRDTTTLNGRWHYIVDPYENGFYNYRRKPFDELDSKEGAFYSNTQQKSKSHLIEYDFTQEPTLNVPGDWNSQKPELLWYEGTLWYLREFDYSLEEGRRLFVNFGASNYETHVYLNGKKLGTHVGGFTPFQFEVTDTVRRGKNFLVAKVDNRRSKEAVPTEATDWWNYGGLTRDVDLIETPATYLDDYVFRWDPKKEVIRGFVQMDGAEKAGASVEISLPELGVTLKITTDASGRAEFELHPKAITLWSVLQPKLYETVIATKAERVSDRIGFRHIEARGRDVYLNGRKVFFRGISIHEEIPMRSGRAYSLADARVLLGWARDLGCNFVRLAHYPHNEHMVRAAEEMGLMVWSEIPVYWTIQWENEAVFDNAANQLTEMIRRDRNRANVVIWSVGNETPVSDARNRFMQGLAGIARELDPTRLVAAALEVDFEPEYVTIGDPFEPALDLVSFNQYIGWYGSLPEATERIVWKIPQEKPVFISETGAGALQGFHADATTRFSEEYQADYYRRQIAMLKKIDKLRGMTPWILADFRSPRRPHPKYQNFWNRKGLISETGTPKQAFQVLKDYYREVAEQYPDF